MKLITSTIILAASAVLPTPAFADYSQTCGYDFLGNYNCNNSLGGSTTIRRNFLGQTEGTYTDGRGNSVSCTAYTDFLGRTVTDCD